MAWSTNRLTLLYILALSAVALLVIAGQILVQWNLVRQLSDSRVVNLAGRQRMLSQRLTMQSLLLRDATSADSRAALQSDLNDSVQSWTKAHLALQQGDPEAGLPDSNSPEIQWMFDEIDPDFQAIGQLTSILLELDPAEPVDVEPTHFPQLLAHQESFLAGMDQIVDRYDREAFQRVARLRNIELTLLLVTLTVLLLEGTLVFRPAVARLRKTLRQLAETSEHLAAARDVAEAANREKTNFLAKMSHELRTPMNAILGLSEVMRRYKLSAKQLALVDTIHDSAKSLMRLLNDLLDMSKLEIEPTLPLHPQPTHLGSLIHRAAQLFTRQAAERGLSLTVQLAPEMEQGVMVDEDRFRQVLVNLMQNALKFTEQGGVTLEGEVLEQSTESVTFCLLVRDTGIGIPPENRETIFQPFRQASQASGKKPAEGVGLGLSIARGIMEALGGTLDLQETGPAGTTFAIQLTLPKAEGAELPSSAQSCDSDLPSAAIPDLRILVVEDTTANQVVMDAMLAELGLRSQNVYTAAEADEALATWVPDCILLDLELPDAQGQDLARKWRAEYESADRPCPVLIAVTAHATASHREDCEAAGFDEFLTKPLSLAALGRVLALHFGGDHSPSGSAAGEAGSAASGEPHRPAISEYPPQLRDKLARLFLDQWSELLHQLQQAAEAGDCEQVVFYAHRLKSVVGNFGPCPAHDILAGLDRDDLALQSEATQAQLHRLPQELAQLAVTVEQRWLTPTP